MPDPDPKLQREFALDVLKTLRKRGFVAYWAGGCVRDMLLGRVPKDYDVATDATPQLVREIFGRRRTIFTGAVFGVVNVLGPRHVANVEVATFRTDASYSDGRHPDSVTFSTPEGDAGRRDFTINGLFYDPIDDQVIDFVGGQQDLQRKVVRAIGNPIARIAEDKLRMLRAVRFSAKYDFELEAETATAISKMVDQVNIVSMERIAQEFRLMLTGPRPRLTVELLHGTGLLKAVLPEVSQLADAKPSDENGGDHTAWSRTLAMLDALVEVEFRLGSAALFHALRWNHGLTDESTALREASIQSADLADTISQRLKLSNQEREDICWLVRNQHALRNARNLRWSQLQPLAIDPRFANLITLERTAARIENRSEAEADYCQELLQKQPDELNPPPLLSGDDLIRHGVERGRIFAALLQATRDAQLDGEIGNPKEALQLVDRFIADNAEG